MNDGRRIPEEPHFLVLGVVVAYDLRRGHFNFHSVHNEFASLFQRLLLTLGVLGTEERTV